MSRITVLKVNKTKADKGYDVIELAYKTDDGKTKGMKIFPFGDQKELAAVAAASKVGDVLEASFTKNEKGFWNFASLRSTGETAPASGTDAAKASPRSTFETPEERAVKQVKISKQAVLNTSVAFFEAAKVKPTKEDVVSVAQYFLDFVDNKSQIQQTGEVE